MEKFKDHKANGSRRPKGVEAGHRVHVKGGGYELIQFADRVDWRNVSQWKFTDLPVNPIVDYGLCDGVCDE
jgi:hypothetical protein